MTKVGPGVARVEPSKPWLSQGDVFRRVMISRFGVSNSVATEGVDHGPALLVSHACAIDKKNGQGRSTLEYLSFLPLQSVSALQRDRQGNIRASDGKLQPYSALYLGEVPDVGESYVPLVQPFTVPAVFFQTELQEYSAGEAGDDAGAMIRPTVNDTRSARLNTETLRMFWRKWAVQWTGIDPLAADDATTTPTS